jgi:hypothetical protein
MKPVLLALLALLLAAPAAPAAVAAKKKPKPSIKVMGISVNRAYVAKGGKIEADDGTNNCYIISGADGAPDSLTAYAYIKAVKIPASAKLTYEFHTPWDDDAGGDIGQKYDGPFSKGLFPAKPSGGAAIYNGPTGRGFYATYRQYPSGGTTSLAINGTYSMTVSVKVGGKTLKSSASLPVNC